MIEQYVEQVKLLVNVLPYVAKEDCFALKGGTAINLFVRDLPRLSVDIDLAYIGFEDRNTSFANINSALQRISDNLNKVNIKSVIQKSPDNIAKIICSNTKATIKIEPNYTIRGYAYMPTKMTVSDKVQEKYGFAAIKVVSHAELFGGKICAALDRQHPRDLFDIKYLLTNEGITDDIKNGFIINLLQHNRPPYELLSPNKQDLNQKFRQEFEGMSDIAFSVNECNCVFDELVCKIKASLNNKDKQFLEDFFSLSSNLDKSYIPNIEKLPAIQWKLQNLKNLKERNSEKFENQIKQLRASLNI